MNLTTAPTVAARASAPVLGVLVGLAIAALVHLSGATSGTVGHGGYVPLNVGGTTAYSSSLTVALDPGHASSLTLLTGAAIGLLLGVLLSLVLAAASGASDLGASGLSAFSPSARARR